MLSNRVAPDDVASLATTPLASYWPFTSIAYSPRARSGGLTRLTSGVWNSARCWPSVLIQGSRVRRSPRPGMTAR